MTARLAMGVMYFALLTGVTLLCLSTCLAQVQRFPSGVSRTECRDRLFWIWVDKSFFGSDPWQLEALNNVGSRDVMSTRRAAQCGYTITNDVYGNVEVRISFFGCWVKNINDKQFDVDVQFRINRGGRINLYPVFMSCANKGSWEVREIVCEENYMEVSVTRIVPVVILKSLTQAGPVVGISQRWQVWFNNSNVPIAANDAISKGYGVNATVTRVVFRAPYQTPESQVVQIGKFHLDVIPSNMLYSQTLIRIIVDTTLACPQDPPVFTATGISWQTPAILTPLVSGDISNDTFDMGINGEVLNSTVIESYNYVFQSDGREVEVAVPYGAPGGYLESDIENNTYVTKYSIHLYLQRHWVGINEDDFTTHTVYKPVVAPVIIQVPVFLDHTFKDNKYFNVSLGNFYSDVSLKSFIIHNVPVKLDALIPRQMTTATTTNPNNTQAFYLTVPFKNSLVETTYLGGLQMRYRLYVTYIMTLITKNKNFSYTGMVECVLPEVKPPNITSHCEPDRVIIDVSRGNLDYYWLPYIRDLPLDNALIASQKIFVQNSASHLYIEVPCTSVGFIYEEVTLDGSLVTLNFTFRDNQTQKVMASHAATCPCTTRNITCISNGTIVVTIDSTTTKPVFDARKAHLRDSRCRPQEATTERALFKFAAYTCGTTRRFEGDYLVYENEVTFDREVLLPQQPIISRDSSYRLTVRCRYPIRGTLWLSVQNKSSTAHMGNPDNLIRVLRRRARGHVAELTLAKDDTFTAFYQNEDFPISVQSADVLYIQTDLQSPESRAALKDCWATTFPGQDGITKWDLVVDGCGAEGETISTKVQTTPDCTPQLKVTLHEAPTSQLFIHCKVIISDAVTQLKSCPQTCNQTEHLLDKRSASLSTEVVSAGPIQITSHPNGVVYQHVVGEHSSSTWTWVLSLGLAVIAAFTVGAVVLTIRLFIR